MAVVAAAVARVGSAIDKQARITSITNPQIPVYAAISKDRHHAFRHGFQLDDDRMIDRSYVPN